MDDSNVLPERLFYKLSDAATKLNCKVEDIYHYAATSEMKLSAYVSVHIEKSQPMILCSNNYEEIDQRALWGDGWVIGGVTPCYGLKGSSITNTHYINSMSGFFFISPLNLFNLEFNSNIDSIQSEHLTTHPINPADPRNLYEPKDGYFIYDPSGYITVKLSHLCIMASELKLLSKLNLKMPKSKDEEKNESSKTLNSVAKMLYEVLELLPAFDGLDITNLPVAKIKDLVEAYAIKNNRKCPSFDRKTWSKYLGR